MKIYAVELDIYIRGAFDSMRRSNAHVLLDVFDTREKAENYIANYQITSVAEKISREQAKEYSEVPLMEPDTLVNLCNAAIEHGPFQFDLNPESIDQERFVILVMPNHVNFYSFEVKEKELR